jgi:hypothetical protein
MSGVHHALPLLVVATVLILAAGTYYVRWGFGHAQWHGRPQAVPVWLAFNDIGMQFAAKIGDSQEAVATTGYDGQFYYYLARHPRVMLQCVSTLQHCPIDANPLREERVLYPLTARLLALNHPDWLHVWLFLINCIAILATVLLVGQLCVDAGASRWLGMAVGIFCGEALGLVRDLADPYAVMWIAVAVFCLRKQRPLWCAAAVGAAILTREQLVTVLPLLALPLLAQRRWRTLVAWAVIAFTPFVAWQVVLHAIFGTWGVLGTVADTHGVTFPFHGLWENRHEPEFDTMVAFAVVPLLFTVVVSLDWLYRYRLQSLLTDPLPLVALVYCVLYTLTGAAEWNDMWAAGRLLTPAVVLGVVIACQSAPALRHAYAAIVGMTAFALLLMLPALF